VGQIEWLLYGSGHVHGLEHNGSALLDFERDALHRETGRTLQGQEGHTLTIRRRWDALGRLQALASQGLQGQAQVPQVLIGQISQRQYHYDALGQLTAVQTAQDTLRYGYDAAGRLRAMQQGEQQQRWSVDPAGNRLPQPLVPGQAPEADWASQVHAHWRQQDFNLLGQAEGAASGTGAVTRWPDNRIGFSEQAAWRYDAQGNRVEQLRQDGQRQQLIYDGANRLIEVLLHDGRRSRYRYDALGRRLAQTTEGASGAPMRYHGWDGDRLVHTEQVDATQPGQRHITHTVYEPETFTPLVQLSATASAQAKPQVLALMAQSQDEDDNGDDNAQMAQMLDALPQDMRQALEQSLRQAMQDGIPQSVKALMPDQSQNTVQRLTGLREQLEKQEQNQQTEITVRHYHCDHLGTPIALTDEQQNIVWAARLDPWGNIEQEFNPHDIEQSIRLPGQHHDKETGLYYNRHRYYDPSIGAYVNQDPIGLNGGVNLFVYLLNPKQSIDPFGLMEVLARQLPSGDSMGEYRYYFDFNCGPGCVEGRAIFDATAGRLSRLLSNAGKIEKRTKSTAGLSDIENYQDRLTCSKHEKSLEEKFKELGHKPGLLGSGSSFTEAQAREVMNKLGEQLPRDIKDKYGWNTIIDRAKERARPTLTTIPR
jgi:RHS repeat-associated protein